MTTEYDDTSFEPPHTSSPTDQVLTELPLYGYRPAVNAIVNRLKSALTSQCVPALKPDSSGNVSCLILVSFPTSVVAKGTSCSALPGLTGYTAVDPTVLQQFNSEQSALAGDSGATTNLANEVTCSLNQIAVPAGQTCAGQSSTGWCYVTGAGVGGGSTCTQAIAYTSPSIVPNGATINLQCIQQGSNGSAASSGAADAATGG